MQDGLRAEKDEGCDEVAAESRRPVCLSERIVAGEVEDCRREKRPGITDQCRPDDVVKGRKKDIVGSVSDEDLHAQEEAEGRPAGKGDAEGPEPRAV